MIDLTNAPKDATHHAEAAGLERILLIDPNHVHPVRSWLEGCWVPSLLTIDWLIDNATRIEWPVELEDGKAYGFNVRGGDDFKMGIYNEYTRTMTMLKGQHVDLASATNIIPLVPEVK